jgi:predicted Rossmann fold nucleotide-binding protein DprA/Smf involved in DNA uptake
MTDRQQILRDLLTSRSTADAICDHTDLPLADINATLADEEIAGTVETRPLATLTVWQLTEAGRAIASTLPKTEPQF